MAIATYHLNEPDLRSRTRPPPRLDIYRTGLQRGYRTAIVPNTRARTDMRAFAPQFAALHAGKLPLPGLELLGCGYNVFGEFASRSSCMRRLFDPEKCRLVRQFDTGAGNYWHYDIVTAHLLDRASRWSIVGQSALEMCESLTVRAGIEGGYAGFWGTLESEYSRQQTTNMYSAFANVVDVTQCWQLGLNDVDALREYLYDDIRHAIDTWEPGRLFAELGVHFVNGVVMGGRLSQMSCTDTFTMKTETELKVAAEAHYLDFIGAEGGVATASQIAQFQSISDVSISTVGGEPTLGGGTIVDQASYQRWKNTIRDKAGFIDFPELATHKPLRPLSTLAADPARRAALDQAAAVYMASHPNPLGINPSTRRHVSYLVTTYTGDGNGAGTDNHIRVQLVGRDRLGVEQRTELRLHDDTRDNHNKGLIDAIRTFDSVPDVGQLTSIRVHSRPNGDRGGWKVDRIEALCLDNGKRYRTEFAEDTWIASTSDKQYPLHEV